MLRTRTAHHRPLRGLAVMAVCCAFGLAVAGAAVASNGPNYGNFNPLTGKPYVASPQVAVKYGDFNPLAGRPNSAPRPASSPASVSPAERQPAVQAPAAEFDWPSAAVGAAAVAGLLLLLLTAMIGIGRHGRGPLAQRGAVRG